MGKLIKRLSYEWIYLRKIRLTPKGLWILLLVVRDSLKWCFNINLGNIIEWKGNRYYINNGNNVDTWSCLLIDDAGVIIRNKEGVATTVYIPKTAVRKLYYIGTPFSDFMDGFRFYMGYWYCIWINGFGEYGKYRNRPKGIRK